MIAPFPDLCLLVPLHKRPYKARFIANASSCTTRHFQLSLRYDLRYTRNFNRFLGGSSRLSNLVGENPILLLPNTIKGV